jgi:hypothetical protein
MSAAQTAMNTLSAQWYNAVTHGCGLSVDQFQLMQGAMPVGATSENLWNIFDSVPPLTATTYYNPAQLNKLSQDYCGIISALIPQGLFDVEQLQEDHNTTPGRQPGVEQGIRHLGPGEPAAKPGRAVHG